MPTVWLQLQLYQLAWFMSLLSLYRMCVSNTKIIDNDEENEGDARDMGLEDEVEEVGKKEEKQASVDEMEKEDSIQY